MGLSRARYRKNDKDRRATRTRYAVRKKEKERKRRGGKQHRDTGYKHTGVSLAAVSTPRNANESPHPAKRINEQQQSLGH